MKGLRIQIVPPTKINEELKYPGGDQEPRFQASGQHYGL
jgi:hypothetical protein